MRILAAIAVFIFLANILALLALILRRIRRPGRAALIAMCVFGTFIASCVWYAYCYEPGMIRRTYHTIHTSKLQRGTHIRIVHLTDLHIQQVTSRELRMLNYTAYEAPDLIVMTGDYTNSKVPATYQSLTQIAGRLSQTAPTFAVSGNWDIPADRQALEAGSVTFLDKWITFRKGGAELALGPADWMCGKPLQRPQDTMSSEYKVLLSHMPYRFAEATKLGIDLTLAGHSHGGQVRLPLIGAIIIDRARVGHYVMGNYKHRNSVLYVSRGIGMVGGGAPKVRFLCTPEIAVFDIVGDGVAGNTGVRETSYNNRGHVGLRVSLRKTK